MVASIYPAVNVTLERISGDDLVPVGGDTAVFKPGETITVVLTDIGGILSKPPDVVVRNKLTGVVYIQGDSSPGSPLGIFADAYVFSFGGPLGEGVYEAVGTAYLIGGFFGGSETVDFRISKTAPPPPEPPPDKSFFGGLKTIGLIGLGIVGLLVARDVIKR